MLLSDLGCDVIRIYSLSKKGATFIRTVPVPSATGPRHLQITTDGFVYIIGELTHIILVYTFDASDTGEMNLV